MTIEDWCKKNGISRHQYHYWNKRVRRKQQADEEIEFTDVPSIVTPKNTAGQNSGAPSDFRIVYKGIQVSIPETFNPIALAGLMKVLQEL
jgi:hypothetical protein